VIAFACRRRWRLAALSVATPALALASEQTLKQVFGREKMGGLAYPSGHVALTIVVTSMAVILLGTAVWAVVAAIVINVLGLFGQAFTNHYFTDTIGAALLATALVGIAVRLAGLDRCQPRCDLDHSSG
jgi:PAP2 superfamily protein